MEKAVERLPFHLQKANSGRWQTKMPKFLNLFFAPSVKEGVVTPMYITLI